MREPTTTSLSFTPSETEGPAEDRIAAFLRTWPATARLRFGALAVVIGLASMGLSTVAVPRLGPPAPDAALSAMSQAFDECMEAWDLPLLIGAPSMGPGASPTSFAPGHTFVWKDAYGITGSVSTIANEDQTGTESYSYSGTITIMGGASMADSGMPWAISGFNMVGADSIVVVGYSGGALDCWGPGCQTELNAQATVVSLFYDPPVLIIDGADHSRQYTSCLDASGYTRAVIAEMVEQHGIPQAEQADSAPLPSDTSWTEAQTQANNQWAECARRNGLAAQGSITDLASRPQVTIPSSTSEDQLRQVLSACPDFDPVQEEGLAQWVQDNPGNSLTNYPGDYLPSPRVNVELTPLDTARLRQRVVLDTLAQPLFTHLTALYMILRESSDEYDRHHSVWVVGG